MLHIHFGNRIERLVDALADVIGESADLGALTPESIVVGHPGMEEWLKRALAERCGIAANLAFQQPGSFVWRMLRARDPDLPIHSPLERGPLIWRLYAALTDLSAIQAPVIAQYLNAGDERTPFELAEILATLFEQYQIYRPQWIRDWEAERTVADDSGWQAMLWRRVAEGATPNPAQLYTDFVANIGALAPANDLPARVSIFGVSALAPAYLELFSALAQTRDVFLFVPNPSRAYWGDIEPESRLARWQLVRPDRAEFATSGHPLLSALGTQTRDFIELLHDLSGDWISHEHFEQPIPGSLLTRLQSDILDLADPDTEAVRVTDESVQVHVCHSRRREIEVLHDTLLACFETDSTLGCEDILVMAPNIAEYADHISTVFGGAPFDRYIPWSLADLSVREKHPIAEAVLELLDLPDSRFRVSDVLGLLELPAIARRYDLDTQSLGDLRRWVERVGVRWGIDGAHRAALGLPAQDGYSWRFGLDRLLAGYAIAPNDGTVWEGIAPWAEFEGHAARPLGALCAFVDLLAQWRDRIAVPRPLVEWAAVMHELLSVFEPEDGNEAAAIAVVRQAVNDLSDQAQRAEFAGNVPRAVARSALAARLAVPHYPRPFLSGRVTFCALAPMRSVPARVVWLLGMSEADFPRRGRPPGFDLIAKRRQLGDRARRIEDRALFLEALGAARRAFHVSYVGRSERDDSALPPSVVLNELLDVLVRMGAEEETVVQRHPLQPFSARYRAEPQRGASYAKEWLGAPKEAVGPAIFAPCAPLECEIERVVTLEELIRAFGNPARTFQQALGIAPAAEEILLEDDEPFTLDALGRWRVRDALLTRWLEQGEHFDPRASRSEFSARGWLPLGEVGRLAFGDVVSETEQLVTAIWDLVDEGSPKTCNVDLAVGDWQLLGHIPDVYPQSVLVCARAGTLRAKDRLAIWLRHLAFGVHTHADVVSHFIGLDKGKVVHSEWGAVMEPATELRNLCQLYARMHREALPLLPDLSMEFSQTARRQGADAAFRKVTASWGNARRMIDGATEYAEVFRGRELFDKRFAALARTIFDPILAAEVAK